MTLNPFASRFIDPHRCEYVLPELVDEANSNGLALAQLPERLLAVGGVAQICGPHGCGKSTLAAKIGQTGSKFFSSCRTIVIRPRGRSGVSVIEQPMVEGRNHDEGQLHTLTILDGFENLTWLQRWMLLFWARRGANAMLITTHCAIPLVPVLAKVKPNLTHFSRIVAALQRDAREPVAEEDIKSVYVKHHGNYRLGLAELYDIYAERQFRVRGATQREETSRVSVQT